MSNSCQILPVKGITSVTKKSTVIVRVLRQWTQKDRFNKETIEVILADQEGSRIQATLPPNFARRFKPLLEENCIVMIKNFDTTPNNISQYQKAIINHPVKIAFIQPTKVQTFISPEPIDENCFYFTPFANFISGEPLDENIVVDVIGEVVKPLGIPEPVPAAANSRKLELKLKDQGGYVLDCTLWESYADRLIKQVEEAGDQIVVMIIQFGKYSRWNNKIRVQSMRHATKIHFSESIPEIGQFLKGLLEGGPVQTRSLISSDSRPSNIEDFFNISDVKTIPQLLSCAKAGIYTVFGRIEYVDHESKWYYDACGNERCTKGIEKGSKIGDVCKKCNKPVPAFVPRYKLTMIVSDTELIEDGGEAKFVIFDKSVNDLLKHPASQVLSKLSKHGDKQEMPLEFDVLIERKCLFRVEVDQRYNINESSLIYTVKKLTDDPTLIQRFHLLNGKDNEVASRLNDCSGSTSLNVSETADINCETSNTLKSCELTPAKRLFRDCEGTSDSKLQDIQHSSTKGKIIKKEKF